MFKRMYSLGVMLCALAFSLPMLAEETQVINPLQFKTMIVEPVLNDMRPFWGDKVAAPQAVDLLVGTVFQESLIGNEVHLKQVGGPALGVYQIEPNTHEDIYENYLSKSHRLEKLGYVRSLAKQRYSDLDQELVSNLAYATAIARVKYWRRTFEWPEMNDPEYVGKLGKIWDDHYNANDNAGFVHEFAAAFPREILSASRSM